MMSYEPGAVVEVPFPFVDRPVQKLRPALVLSHAEYARESGVVVLVMITSARRSSWNGDVVLRDWSHAGLRAPSLVRWKVFSLDAGLIQGNRGKLSPTDCSAVASGFRRLFGAWGKTS